MNKQIIKYKTFESSESFEEFQNNHDVIIRNITPLESYMHNALEMDGDLFIFVVYTLED